MAEEKEKVVLAYSGGLDTSICIKWLQLVKNLDVIAMIGEVGQEHDGLEAIRQKALRTGAIEAYVVDMRQEFDDDDSSFENNDYDLGDNVMVESELQDDYSVKDADEGFDDDLDEDAGPTADDLAAIESDSFDD